MSIIYMAEKPSQARELAKAIGVVSNGSGYIQVKDGFVVQARGHLFEQAQPQDYNEAWGGRWSFDVLPMVPEIWKRMLVKAKSAQLKVIKDLLKKASLVVIATDAGREGELIAREILEHCRYRGPIKRLWTSSLVQEDFKRGLADLWPGAKTEPLYEAAVARAHADWLYGINGSRAVTLAANSRGTVYPVGRVQTPTLAMVVRREWEIRNFVPVAYYELDAEVQSAGGHKFKMTHAPAEKDRIKDKEEANRRKAIAEGAQGPLEVKTEAKKESPPLPYTLPALQTDANRIFKFSARRTLELAQELYEAKATTYPRTDCAYLASSQKQEVPAIVTRLEKVYPETIASFKKHGPVLRDSTFNDEKLTDHHAICPTSEEVSLTPDQEKIFSLVVQRYLRALSADCLFNSTSVVLNANGVPFKATGKQITDPGFRSVSIIADSEDKEA